MIPLSDTTPRKIFPLVNYFLIVLNILAFALQLFSFDFDNFIYNYGFIPARFHPYDIYAYVPLIASIFLHGGFFHLFSNMWVLHIFGDNVEGKFGHIPYLAFYLLCGIVASLVQFYINPQSSIPVIGASGAISGICGAYLVFFASSRIKTLIPIGIFIDIVDLPSSVFLVLWFIIQLFSGLGSLTSIDIHQGGTAWFAHIGGFIFGYLYALMLK